MPRIVVGIPTYNEADTIGHVLRCVDAGLALLARDYGPVQAKIVNADSLSPDGTASAFSAQTTSFPKQQVSTGGAPGKGKNVRKLLGVAAAFEADCLILLDGDLYSIRPEWLPALVLPVLRDQVDLVLPRYARSRFDGSTTNLFCVPLLFSVFGQFVRQPIAGDFGLSRRLIDLVRQAEWPPSADYYGIDITLTIAALKASCNWAEVRLGQKLHKPSFPKIAQIFSQVCDAALWSLNRTAVAARAGTTTVAAESIKSDSAFPVDEWTASFLSTAEQSVRVGSANDDDGQPCRMRHIAKRMIQNIRDGVSLSADAYSNLWCEALTEAARAAIAGSGAQRPVGPALLPSYLVMTCSLWARIRDLSPRSVEAEIVRFAELVRRRLTADPERAQSRL